MCSSFACSAVWFLVHNDEFSFILSDDAFQEVIIFMVVLFQKTGADVLAVALMLLQSDVLGTHLAETLLNPRMSSTKEYAVPWLTPRCNAISSVLLFFWARIMALASWFSSVVDVDGLPKPSVSITFVRLVLLFLSTHIHFSVALHCPHTECVNMWEFHLL